LNFFGQPFVKPFALCYRTVVLSVCNVGALRPNGWMDQDETWHGAPEPRPLPHWPGDTAPPPPQGHNPQFSAHSCCGQMAGWIKMPLGTMVYLVLGNIVLDADPAPPPRGTAPPNYGPCVVTKQLDGSRCHLVQGLASAQSTLLHGDSATPLKRGTAPNFRPTSVVAKRSPISATAEHLFYIFECSVLPYAEQGSAVAGKLTRCTASRRT